MSTTAESATLPEKYLITPQGVVMNPEYVALWEPYLEEGMGYKHVAEVFGVGKSTVRNHYPGRGWTHRQVVEQGRFMRDHNRKMQSATFAKQM